MIRRSLPGFLVITIQSQLLSKQEASSQENWLPSILPPRKSDYTTRAEDYPTLDCYLAKPRNTSRETKSRLIETDILSSPDTADPRPETRTTLTLMASFLNWTGAEISFLTPWSYRHLIFDTISTELWHLKIRPTGE